MDVCFVIEQGEDSLRFILYFGQSPHQFVFSCGVKDECDNGDDKTCYCCPHGDPQTVEESGDALNGAVHVVEGIKHAHNRAQKAEHGGDDGDVVEKAELLPEKDLP